MSDGLDSQDAVERRSRIAWRILNIVLILEGIGSVALLWQVVQGFLAASEDPLGARLSVLLAALIGSAWVCVTLGGALSKQAGWARGSALTIHVLLFAAGTGILQGIIGDPLLGWVLVLLAFVGFFAAVLARPAQSEA